jgi:hypothetical protein
MSAIFKGNCSQDLLPDLEFIPKVGIRQRPKHLRRREQAVTLAQAYMAAGMRASVTQEGESPIWRVTAEIDGDPSNPDPELDLQNTHELRVNVLNPDIKTNLVLQSQFTGGAVAAISAVEKISNDRKSGKLTNYNAAVDAVLASSDIETADVGIALSLLDELLQGADTFVDFQYVYSHTFNFGAFLDKVSDYSNVGCIFTSSQITAIEKVPEENVLPDGEWIKLPPERTDMIGGRTLLKYEYWWAQGWSRLRYAVSS